MVRGMPLAKVIGTFPIDLLLNLVGVTLLFGMANNNGTLGRIAARAVRACKGSAGVIPIMFFLIAVTLSSIGPGNIATTAIMAPMAMAVGARAAIPPFLMALMVGNGAQAGALSRFAPTGIIVKGNMEAIGLPGHETQTYLNNLLAHAVVVVLLLSQLRALRGDLGVDRSPELIETLDLNVVRRLQRVSVQLGPAYVEGGHGARRALGFCVEPRAFVR